MAKTLKIVAVWLLIAICIASVSILISKKAKEAYVSKVTIRGYYEEPESIRSKETIVLKGVLEGEFIEVKVNGTIKDFMLVRLEWDGIKNDVVEKEVVHRIGILKDKTLVIKTYMPEGIPSERLKWKSLSGKQYEFTIAEDLSDESEHFWEYLMN